MTKWMGRKMEHKLINRAVDWFVRLRGDNLSDEDHQQYRDWLDSDNRHEQAGQKIDEEWQSLGELSPWAATELTSLSQKFDAEVHVTKTVSWWLRWSRPIAVATGVIAVAIVSFNLLTGQPGLLDSNLVARGGLLVNKLLYGDTKFETLEGEQRKITLRDGSRAHLNSASLVQVHYTDEIREITLLQGEALFEVVKQASRPFVVKAGNRKVVAVGTTFSVYFKQDDIQVTVVEGQVAILPTTIRAKAFMAQGSERGREARANEVSEELNDAVILLTSDHQVSVSAKGKAGEVKVVEASKLTAWERGLLVLDGMPLRQVAEEISRYVPGEVWVANGVPDYPVTGVIKIRDKESMLRLLSEVVPVTAVRESSKVTTLYASLQSKEGGTK